MDLPTIQSRRDLDNRQYSDQLDTANYYDLVLLATGDEEIARRAGLARAEARQRQELPP